jgi:hypothetical protein
VNPQLDALIALYAEHGLQGVKNVEEFRLLCEAHEDDVGFNSTLNQVRDTQAQLEDILRDQTYRQQVEFSLREISSLWDKKKEDKGRVCRELVLRGYARHWSSEQKTYFDETSEKLTTWRDYFLSFTSHKPSKPEVSFVNNEHKLLIGVGMGLTVKPPEAITQNLVARLLDYRLQNLGYYGFYFPEHKDAGTVEAKLIREASQSFAFVQLLQSTMFRRHPSFCQIEV